MRVTVGIPFLNARRTLPDAIRSVFAQTFEDWELILLDDGSADGSLEIARSVCDPRVRIVCDGMHKGLHSRLNEIAVLARGDYLARMDADDLMHPDRLARQVQCLEADVRLDLIGTGVYVIDAQDNFMGIRDTGPLDTRPESVLAGAILPHPTITGRTRWFRDNPYDERFPRAEDYELWRRTCSRSRFAKITEPLYYLREGARRPEDYIKDYLLTAHSVRKALRLYGPPAVGWPRTLRLLASSRLKELAYTLATTAGMQDRLMRMRHGMVPSEAERESAVVGLAAVTSTRVPGMDAVLRPLEMGTR